MRKFPKQSIKIISTLLKAKKNPTQHKTKYYEKKTLYSQRVQDIEKQSVSLLMSLPKFAHIVMSTFGDNHDPLLDILEK